MDDAERQRAERAEARRRTWTGGVVRGFDELEDADLEFWARATPAERVRGVTELIGEMSSIGGVSGSPSRLQGSPGGVRPRRG